MLRKTDQIFCQRCLAANAFGQELCVRCGTRLMLVTEPSTLRYEGDGETGLEHEEHLLERVSALESGLARIVEAQTRMLDLLHRQTQMQARDVAMLESLVYILTVSGALNPAQLEKLLSEREQQGTELEREEDRYAQCNLRIMAGPQGAEPGIFARLVREGMELCVEGKTARGLKLLERAAALAPENAPLQSFIGEHFFRAGKMTLARDYLARAAVAAPEERRARLLLAIAAGDEGEFALAKSLLAEMVRSGEPSFAAHFALGYLLALEQNWAEAIGEFKAALATRPGPEVHYVMGLIYYHAERDRLAERHLRKAVELDAAYADAFYVLGLTLWRLGERERAMEVLAAAQAVGGDESRYSKAFAEVSKGNEAVLPQPPLFLVARQRRKGALTGGDKRLAAVLRASALA